MSSSAIIDRNRRSPPRATAPRLDDVEANAKRKLNSLPQLATPHPPLDDVDRTPNRRIVMRRLDECRCRRARARLLVARCWRQVESSRIDPKHNKRPSAFCARARRRGGDFDARAHARCAACAARRCSFCTAPEVADARESRGKSRLVGCDAIAAIAAAVAPADSTASQRPRKLPRFTQLSRRPRLDLTRRVALRSSHLSSLATCIMMTKTKPSNGHEQQKTCLTFSVTIVLSNVDKFKLHNCVFELYTIVQPHSAQNTLYHDTRFVRRLTD